MVDKLQACDAAPYIADHHRASIASRTMFLGKHEHMRMFTSFPDWQRLHLGRSLGGSGTGEGLGPKSEQEAQPLPH